MDHNSIIDKENYEVYLHAEDYPKAFICDKYIAKAIAELNKKGYQTFASCSGHYEVAFYEEFDVDINKLEEYQNDKWVIIKNIYDNSFDCWYEKYYTNTYILFADNYNFDSAPEGFNISYSEDPVKLYDRVAIDKNIYYYNEDGTRKKRAQVEAEIESSCQTLLKWAERLPERKDDKKWVK